MYQRPTQPIPHPIPPPTSYLPPVQHLDQHQGSAPPPPAQSGAPALSMPQNLPPLPYNSTNNNIDNKQQIMTAAQNGELPGSFAGTKGHRTYQLVVEQQPIRARMCGFGDKDRRPITPPPCIRLIVTGPDGKEVDFSEVDSSFFVLNVDLWSENGSHEVNLVRHSNGAPTVSISSSAVTSYPPPADRPIATYGPPGFFHAQALVNGNGPIPAAPTYAPQQNGVALASPQGYYQQQQQPQTPVAPNHGFQYPPQSPAYPQQQQQAMMATMPIAHSTPTATGMFTRNLIGSLSVNAFRLNDTKKKPGFWFVLQDLSVRTEGTFRLKMNFVDVGSGTSPNQLNTGRAPVLASCFSEPFQVFSAKKFPGVIESTPLSKAFAQQGIKIPIRKDGPKVPNSEEYDNDEDRQQ